MRFSSRDLPGLARKGLAALAGTPVGHGALTFVILWLAASTPTLHVDTVRDLLTARDCSDLGVCHALGAGSSLDGFSQGSAWIGLLGIVQMLGGGIRAVQIVVILFESLGVAILSHVTARWISADHAAPAAAIFAYWLWMAANPALLWNPSVVPLPVALAFAGLVVGAHTGRIAPLALAGLSVAVATMGHVVCILLLVPLLLVAAIAARSVARALCAGALALVLPLVALSPAMLQLNVQAAVDRGWAWPGFACAITLLVGGFACRRRWAHLPAIAKTVIVAAACGGPVVAGIVWHVIAGRGLDVWRYTLPAAPALSWLGGAAASCLLHAIGRKAESPVRTGGAVASGLALAVMLLPALLFPHRTSRRDLRFKDVDVVAPRASAIRTSWDDLAIGLQGPLCWDLAIGISVDAPIGERSRDPGRQQAIRVLDFDRATSPLVGNAGSIVDLAYGRAAAISPIDSWIRWAEAQVCRIRPGGNRTCNPIRMPTQTGSPIALHSLRVHPRVHDLETRDGDIIEYDVPVRAASGEPERIIDVLGPTGAPCPWKFTAIEGFESQDSLPSVSLHLLAPAGPARIRFARMFDLRRCGIDRTNGFIPCLLETRPEEDVFRRLAREGAR
jgi:hypothetical protein